MGAVGVGLIRDLNERAARLSIIIAGSCCTEYDPYEILRDHVRRGIVVGLHLGYSVESIARLLGVSKQDVEDHLGYLREADLVVEREERLVTGFFIALREDVVIAKDLARSLGVELGELYRASWDTVLETYNRLSASRRYPFSRVGFVLIGAYSLDMGMLRKFAEEGRIMPEAPVRKGGRYYMWGVEDGMENLGRYGMHSAEIGEYGFATFGGERERRRIPPPDYSLLRLLAKILGEENISKALEKYVKLPARERETINKRLEDMVTRIMGEYERKYQDPSYEINREAAEYLKEWLYLDENLSPQAPIYTKEDMRIIDEFIDHMSKHILKTIYKNLDKIQSTFRKMKASEYANFPEFFCWLYHLVFSEAIDYLIKEQLLKEPLHGYEYWVWKK